LCPGLVFAARLRNSTAASNLIPEELAEQAIVPGIPYARSWGDSAPDYLTDWHSVPDAKIRQRYAGIIGREHTYLAISGGGDNGAFGAGLLIGWTQSGTRPEFTMVTGISTGGLIAPFAFLGSAYDAALQEMYTSYSTDDLLQKRSVLNIVRNDAATDTAPLRAMIAKYMTQEVMEDIAAEYRKGRGLLIGTTNIDAARPVMWNVGRIAASGHPVALELVRDIMLASASIPGAFPPVLFEVEADGQRYDEMHVDGGVTSQVFLYPVGIDWRQVEQRLEVQGRPKVYVIRNAFLDPGWQTVERRIAPIVGRTVSSMIRTQGIGDLYRMYLETVRDGLDFHLAYIPDDMEYTAMEPFDPVYMHTLFERGRSMAEGSYPWTTVPPDLGLSAVGTAN
jgi:hypothetical protein